VLELCCLLAQRPRVVLLDEPVAGVAQAEVEAFGPLLIELRRALGASMLVIEHDLPLVMGISDRMYCLESGAVIATGTPQEIRDDPRVIASYLGTDERAIARSGSAAPTGPGPAGAGGCSPRRPEVRDDRAAAPGPRRRLG